jgi:hypothetical protein
VLDLAILTDQSFQHAMHCHGVPKDKIVTAIREANSLAEYLALLGIRCPDVVSICALPIINVVRKSIGRPELEFDPELHARLSVRSGAPQSGTSEELDASAAGSGPAEEGAKMRY